MNLPNEKGERILYPRLVLSGQLDAEYIAEELADGTTFNAAEAMGMLTAFARKMACYLGRGYSVKVDGLGIFTASLELKDDKEREEEGADATRRNARSIQVGGINFRADKKFVNLTDAHCRLERSQWKFRRSSQKYTPQERLELARQYLDENPYLTIADYAAITGLCRTSASLEIKMWAQQSDSGIGISGRGTHRVYIRKARAEVESTKDEKEER